MDFVRFLLIGFVAGWVVGRVKHGRKSFGLIGNILIGVAGSFIGGFLFGFLGLSATNVVGKLVMAVLGAVSLLLLVNLIRHRRRKKSKEEDE